MPAPEVSVIITAYNVAEYIARVVTSALAQEGVSVEVIVVDDVSTDGTREVLATIHDSRVRVIALTENQGPGGARNQALAQARGEWVAILDGDDAFAPNRLSTLLALAKRENADIVCDNLLCVEGDKEWPMFAPEALANQSPLTSARFIAGNSNFMHGFSLGYLKPVLRREFIESHCLRYDPTIRIGEDYLFLLEALLRGARAVIHPEPLYHYTRRQGSISHRLTPDAVARIEAQDAALLTRYRLDDAARAAQSTRAKNLREAYHYNSLVEAIKARRLTQALKLFLTHPATARHLARPALNRLRGV